MRSNCYGPLGYRRFIIPLLYIRIFLKEAMSRGYFCFRSILCLSHYSVPRLTHSQNAPVEFKQFHQGALIIIYFFGDFAGIALKLSSLNSCPSSPSDATDGEKQCRYA